MNKQKNILVSGADGKDFLLDIYWKETTTQKLPIILFAHGFKGFKDWGHWERIGEWFVEQGYCFIKFNFSHNGTTIDQPLDFADLEAFGQNNYSKELTDLYAVLDWIEHQKDVTIDYDVEAINLIGHSRGGGLALIAAKEDNRIRNVVTWAAVHELDYSWAGKDKMIAAWKASGVHYIMNGRTKQQMPLYIQLYEDYNNHVERFSTQKQLAELQKPLLIIHGSDDPAVSVASANYIHEHAKNSELFIIEGANHVFGGHHPYDLEGLSAHSSLLVAKTEEFIRKNLA